MGSGGEGKMSIFRAYCVNRTFFMAAVREIHINRQCERGGRLLFEECHGPALATTLRLQPSTSLTVMQKYFSESFRFIVSDRNLLWRSRKWVTVRKTYLGDRMRDERASL